MNSFVRVIFWLCVAETVVRFIYLAGASYPRAVVSSRGSDAFSLLLNGLMAYWAFWILYK